MSRPLLEQLSNGTLYVDPWRAASRDQLDANLDRARQYDADWTRRAQIVKRSATVLGAWGKADVAEHRAAIAALLDAKRLRLVVEPRSKRNGSRFDRTRVQVRSAKD